MIVPSNVLITGVAGFIGSHLAERLIQDGHRVIGIDSFTDYYARSIKERNLKNLIPQENFFLIEADLIELDLCVLLKRGLADNQFFNARKKTHQDFGQPVEYVFHLAAQPGVRGSWGPNFQIYTRNNILATQRLLEAAKETALRKFVYASSSSVYGDAEQFPTVEEATPHPISPYGVTKLAAEHLCLLYWRNYGVPVVATRYFTVYGPRQRPDMAFHRFINAILKGAEISVYGDGEQTRDFTFVSDAVDGTLRAAFDDGVGQVFNLGGGSRVSINGVLQTIAAVVQKKPQVKYQVAQRGDARHTGADIRRAETVLKYQPRITLEQGLSLQVQWAKQILEEK